MKTVSRRLGSLGLGVVMSGGPMLFAPAPAAFAHTDGLKDGTKVEIVGDQLFRWDNKKRTIARDGAYTLKSGKTITVKDGKIVKESPTGEHKTEVPNLKK